MMYEQIRRNRRASWLLMGFVIALLAALGFAIGAAVLGGTSGGVGLLGVFGIVAIAWSILGYYSGDKMVLAVSGAHQVTHENEPQLFNVVEEMTIAAGLPNVPAVYVIEEPAPNAFATGRDPQHSSIAVTRGMMQMLDREELQGVVAHEMSHIRNYDIRFATLVGILVGMIALVADFFLRWSFWGGFGRRRGGGDSSGNAGAILLVVGIVLAILAPLAAARGAAGSAGLTAGTRGPSVQSAQRLAIQVALGSEGAGQPQVGPRLVRAPELEQAAPERVVGVVVVRRVAYHVPKALGRVLVHAEGELGSAERLADGVLTGLEAQGLGEQHGGLRRMLLAQEGDTALKERVGLALGFEGRLASGHHGHGRRLKAELRRDALHRRQPDAHELVELQAEFAAAEDGVAVDAARERALAEALAHRLDLDPGEVLVGPHQGGGRDQAAQLVGRKEGDVQGRLGGHPRRRVVSHDRVSDGLGRTELAQGLGGDDALPREVVAGLFAVEVVGEAGEPPEVGVLAETARPGLFR